MKTITAYLCMCYRGENGDNATEEEIEANVQKAIATASAIRRAFPHSLDLYVPHENQETTHRLWKKGFVTSEQILEVCRDIISTKDFLIVLGSISGGMMVEMEYAAEEKKPLIIENVFDDGTKETIGSTITQIRGNSIT